LVNPFEIPGQWYKANLHAHSTNSDGWLSPQHVIRAYRAGGYQILALTDHWKVTHVRGKPEEGFLYLQGVELDGGRTAVGNYHLVGIGVEEQPEREKLPSAQEQIDWIKAQNGIAFIAHPYWSGLTAEDLLALHGYAGIELYNTGCDIEICRGFSFVHWDDLLSRGRLTSGIAVDDGHRPTFDMLQGWTMIKALDLTESAVLEALRNGACYASTGPKIFDLQMYENRIYCTCSPARRISLVSNPTRGHVALARLGERLTDAEFSLPADCSYVRIQIEDEYGRIAWGPPLFPER
jgi:hypothetical protein